MNYACFTSSTAPMAPFSNSFDARDIGCGGYGGLIDGNGILWSVGGALLRYDPVTRSGSCIQEYGYGLGIDTNGYIWMSIWGGGIVKIAPDGTVVPGFPKVTFPTSMTTASEPTGLMAAVPQMNPGADDSVFQTAAEDTSALVLHPQTFASSMQGTASNASGMDRTMNAFSQVETQALSEPLAEDPAVTFQVAPVDDWVQSFSAWTPGASISLSIEEGGTVVYNNSQTADGDGNFNFNLWNVFDLQRGQVVTVSDGTNTKTHAVMPLYVDGVNVTTDTIFGRADSGTDVEIWVHGDGGLNVTTSGSGNWTADLSGQTDLTYLSDGGSRQYDSDGDSTGVWWASPRFQVSPDDEWVQSWSTWTPGTTISLTIADGGSVVYSDSQTVNADGYFNFDLWDVFDLQRGQVVTISDGTTTKTHTVMPLFVDGVNVTADTVFGRADPGSNVDIWVHGDGGMSVTAGVSGNWDADFSSQTDLTSLSDGGSQQTDDDGDSTGVWWASPRFQVAPEDDWVQSWNRWTPGANISLTIEEGGSEVYSNSQIADSHGNFYFDLWEVFDLQRGQVVTISDGTHTKSHTVMDLFVDGVDVMADTVFGRADTSANVDVWVHGDGYLSVTPDSSGNWIADFSGKTDLTYANDGGSQQFDSDGDATGVWWASPSIRVDPEDDWVRSRSRWTPGATIILTIVEGGSEIYSNSQTADVHGDFNFNLRDVFDLQRGQVVTVSDGMTSKTHTVANLFVDSIDLTTDTVSGRADANSTMNVSVNDNRTLGLTADDLGNWSADFSGMTDLTFLSEGTARQFDSDGNFTRVGWASPRFQTAPEDDWVGSWSRWTPGTTISLTIADGGIVVYTDSQTVDTNGNFNFNLWDVFDLQRGQVVTVSNGTTTKTHTVMPLYVDIVDVASDTISGRGVPTTDVEVWVHGYENLYTTTDGSGNWIADFSGQADLTYLSDGGSQQMDDDGDSTRVGWASPSFQVSPDDNWVQQ